MLLVASSMGLSWIMAYENIPQNVSEGLLALTSNPFMILLIINMLLLFVGIFMDMTTMATNWMKSLASATFLTKQMKMAFSPVLSRHLNRCIQEAIFRINLPSKT